MHREGARRHVDLAEHRELVQAQSDLPVDRRGERVRHARVRSVVGLAMMLAVLTSVPPAGAAPATICAKWKIVPSPAIPDSDLGTLSAVGPDDIWAVGNN